MSAKEELIQLILGLSERQLELIISNFDQIYKVIEEESQCT